VPLGPDERPVEALTELLEDLLPPAPAESWAPEGAGRVPLP